MKEHTILVINPGSTTLKIALFRGSEELFSDSAEGACGDISGATEYIGRLLAAHGIDPASISATAARGGILPPVKAGAYRVNAPMVDRLRNRPLVEHASNKGALIAFEFEAGHGTPAYTYDAVSTDEMTDEARLSGMPEIRRRSNFHALNSRAVAMDIARKLGRSYEDCDFVVAHIGGGISISAHRHGRVADVLADDEGPFSAGRSGKVPCVPLAELCLSGKYDKKSLFERMRTGAGLTGYLGTGDAREVESRIAAGDGEAALVYRAMAYQTAKGIGEMCAALCSRPDRIILTGGLARSDMFTGMIKEYAGWLAPFEIVPGEREMQALAAGVLRVLTGVEKAMEYTE